MLFLGESLGGRYRVYGFAGRGVYSNVLRARDSLDSDAPVAIKMIRNYDMMHEMGLEEIEILQRITAVGRPPPSPSPLYRAALMQGTGGPRRQAQLCAVYAAI